MLKGKYDKSSKKVMTGLVRLSYPSLFHTALFDGNDTGKYSTTILIPKKDKDTLNLLNQAIKDAYEAGVKNTFNGKKPSDDKANPLKDGDKSDDSDYKGCYYLKVSNKRKPQIVGPDVKDITNEEEIYAGCYARVTLSFFAYNKMGCGVSASLYNVQKVKDGPRLDGVKDAKDEFQEVDEDEYTDDIDN